MTLVTRGSRGLTHLGEEGLGTAAPMGAWHRGGHPPSAEAGAGIEASRAATRLFPCSTSALA